LRKEQAAEYHAHIINRKKEMKYKRTIAVSSLIVGSLLLLCLTLISCFFLFVPRYVESKILPPILKDIGVEMSSVSVRSIGLTGVELSDIKLGSADSEGLSVDSIRIDYSLRDLTDRHVKKITVSGITVRAAYENGNLSIKGLEKLFESQKKQDNKKQEPSRPFNVNTLLIKNSTLNLKVEESIFAVPFDFTASSFNQYRMPVEYSLKSYPGGNAVTLEGKKEGTDKISLKMTGNNLPLNFFEDLVNRAVPVNMRGKGSIDLKALFSTESFSFSDISLLCRLDKANIRYSGVEMKNPVGSGITREPVNIKLESPDTIHWDYDVSPFLLLYDSYLVSSNMSGNLTVEGDSFSSNTRAVTRLISKDHLPPVQWDISAKGDIKSQKANLQIKGLFNEEAGSIKLDDINVTALSPVIKADLDYDGNLLSGSYRIDLKKVSAEKKEMSFSVPAVSVKGNISQPEDLNGYVLSYSAAGNGVNIKGFDLNGDIPDLRIKGSIKYSMEKGFNADALLSFKNGAVKMEQGQLNINNISGKLPVVWPLAENRGKGKLDIKEINYGDYTLGPVDINIPIKGDSILFDGTALYPALPDMPIKVAGKTSLNDPFADTVLSFEIPGYRTGSDIKLDKLVYGLRGFRFNGNVESRGEVKLSNTILSSGLDFKIENGKLANSKKKLTIENISLNLRLEDLIKTVSPYGQKLKVDKISIGDISVTDFKVDFRIDSLSSIFIEQAKFRWCGGTINIQSFRIETDKDEYLLTLFCDRLSLAQILEQFGVSGVTGGGTVNGKIPVTISNGKISFEDGFLYSTPGGGGKISITGTDIFKQGMAPGTPEYIQMDIASEALKAFDYSWVKMALNSIDDELMVKLQFDGKPEKKLPFRYDKNLNRFMRVESNVEGSNFQGISLDVNLKLPLDELLNYKGALDMINF
jgi:hypothetical protein